MSATFGYGDTIANGWRAVSAWENGRVGILLANRDSEMGWATWLYRPGDRSSTFQGSYYAAQDDAVADFEARAIRHGLTPGR